MKFRVVEANREKDDYAKYDSINKLWIVVDGKSDQVIMSYSEEEFADRYIVTGMEME
jgi:hypothetical protein